MKNKDKYKDAKSAYNAFKRMCDAHEGCEGCMFEGKESIVLCPVEWLYEDADPEPQEELNLQR